MVEKVTFEPQMQVQFLEEKSEIESIPLPNQIPSRLDVDQFLADSGRSNALESLIQQNEDLMARLTVSVRRHALLEEKAGSFEKTLQQLQERNEILADQLMVYREKDKLQSDHRNNFEKKIKELNEQISLHEIRYAEYYSTSRDKIQTLNKNLQHTSHRLKKYLVYRERIRRLCQKQKKHFLFEKQQLETKVENLIHRLQQENLQLGTLKEKLSQAVTHIQRQSVESEKNQRQLVENYESEFSQLKEQAKENENRILELEAKMIDHESLLQSKIMLENKLITQERNMEEISSRFSEETSQLQTSLAEFRQEAKIKHLDVERLQNESLSHKNENRQLSQKNKELEEQLESLQCLWRDTHQKLESQMERYQVLQKLNQQLSASCNEYRRETFRLREERDQLHFQTHTRIKELEGQIKVLSEIGKVSSIGEPAVESNKI